ncbi:MAG: UvrD-helicase domain-containing protein, partial [Candidatus Atribacteria bacterium]|nr:UvrD-helicase domain-containing protein [Candidatus Atribacteria bacterium]
DINQAQYTLIQLLARKDKNLFVVGDPDQSIYRFRGADLSNIIHFEEDYPKCRIIKLEQNYRSSEMILKGASLVIRNNRYRKEKELWTSKKGGEKIKYYEANSAMDEAEFVAREIQDLRNSVHWEWSHFVVLYRTNSQSRAFEEVFAKSNIPFKLVGSIRFYERIEVKDLISLLKIIDNPYEQGNYKRWLGIGKFGIGDKGFQKLLEMTHNGEKTIFDILPDYLQKSGNRITNENKEKIFSHLKLFMDLQKKKKMGISTLAEDLVKKIGYYQLMGIEDDRIKLESKIENVKSLIQSIREYEKMNPGSDLNSFLNYISLISDLDHLENRGNENAVQLMTLHCAKGLEFPVVFLTGLEEGIFPHNKSLSSQVDLEEERRLCYVGMTRAMERLYLTYSWRRNMDGSTKFNQISRFFQEIPGEYKEKVVRIADAPLMEKKNLTQMNQSLKINDWIMHPDWGSGMIISKKEAGQDQYITVQFRSQGIKILSLKYAPIKKIEKNSQ